MILSHWTPLLVVRQGFDADVLFSGAMVEHLEILTLESLVDASMVTLRPQGFPGSLPHRGQVDNTLPLTARFVWLDMNSFGSNRSFNGL